MTKCHVFYAFFNAVLSCLFGEKWVGMRRNPQGAIKYNRFFCIVANRKSEKRTLIWITPCKHSAARGRNNLPARTPKRNSTIPGSYPIVFDNKPSRFLFLSLSQFFIELLFPDVKCNVLNMNELKTTSLRGTKQSTLISRKSISSHVSIYKFVRYVRESAWRIYYRE